MSLAERWSKMEPREQKLLMGLGGAVVALVFLFLPVLLYRSVSAARDDNQAIRDYIQKVAESRDKIDKLRAQNDALLGRYTKTMPPLASFVEDAARAFEVEIAESSAKPDQPHGKKYVEHVLAVKLKKTGLLGIAKMLERIEKSGYPVAITKLSLKPRAGEPDSYDVEMQVSSFERKGAAEKKKTEEAPKEDEP
ncbi:MAG TPA: type II secretion system protein GspM [Polyangiaceae bacterium]|jgi:general secretion pathway protein M|nr:type II secretion system protein GspM [Polyangiaceae bacterium]